MSVHNKRTTTIERKTVGRKGRNGGRIGARNGARKGRRDRSGRSGRSGRSDRGSTIARLSLRDDNALRYRMQHHPLDEDQPALSRTQIINSDGDGPTAYPMRAADTIDALEKKGRIDHKAAMGARKFEKIFQQASLQGYAKRDLRLMPGPYASSKSEPHSILHARDDVWDAMRALGGIGTPGANAAWDVLGLGMTIKGHAERCQFGSGRSLNPMTATGILVQACFTLAVHFRT